MLIILDLDGTIINSEKAHYNSFIKAIEKKGHKLNASQKKGILSKFGMDGKEIIKGALPSLTIGEINDIPVEVSHHKAIGKANWGKVNITLKMIEGARRKGVNIHCDVYPYTAAMTTVSSLLPTKVLLKDTNKFNKPFGGFFDWLVKIKGEATMLFFCKPHSSVFCFIRF